MRFPNIWNVRFALQGIWTAVKEETQLRWGLLGLLCMAVIALWRGVALVEFSIFFGLCVVTLAFEMVNGAIERICDKIQPNYDRDIKKIKDLAAGAVLLISAITFVVWFLFAFF